MLKRGDADALAKLLNCNVEAIRHGSARPADSGPVDLAPPTEARVFAVPELAVEAGASGACAAIPWSRCSSTATGS